MKCKRTMYGLVYIIYMGAHRARQCSSVAPGFLLAKLLYNSLYSLVSRDSNNNTVQA